MTFDSFFEPREAVAAPAALRRSDETWAQVREGYLDGASAPRLAERFGVSVSALRKRAREEGWRRLDAPDPAPVAEADDEEALVLAGVCAPTELRPLAWARAALAVRRGRLAEALGWTRLVRQLDGLAEREAGSPALKARAADSLARAAETLASLRHARATAPDLHEVHGMHGMHGAHEAHGANVATGRAAALEPAADADEALPTPSPSCAASRACDDPDPVLPSAPPVARVDLGDPVRGHGPPEAVCPPTPPLRPAGPCAPPVPPDWVRHALHAR